MRASTPAQPRVLLCATLRWTIAARLALAFARLGWRVDVACPVPHPALHAVAAHRLHRLSGWRPLASLSAAIVAAVPDLVIPCDDTAATQLQQLASLPDAAGRPALALRALIQRSLGDPRACLLATQRGALMALAAAEGIRVPASAVLNGPADLAGWLAVHGLPAVVKVDGTWGGQGVTLVRSADEAQRAVTRCAAPPRLLASITRALLDSAPALLMDALRPASRTVMLQQFIAGNPANRAVACWQGEVLAGISVEALRTLHATGPATVVRIIENEEMAEAARRVVRRLRVSGLWGFDFVLDPLRAAAHLIEVNPRATPICHLALDGVANLPAALSGIFSAVPLSLAATPLHAGLIAMFPGELLRDANSPFLSSAYHDVPWEAPELIHDCLERPWSERGVVARAWARSHAPAAASVRDRREPARPARQSLQGR